MRFVISLLFALAVATMPGLAQSPANTRLLTKHEQINDALELMNKFRSAVAETRKGRETDAYTRIAVQLFKCSVLYSLLAKDPPSGGTATTFLYKNASAVFEIISSIFYGESIDRFQIEVKRATDEIIAIRRDNEEQKLFYLLRNCSELAEAQGKTLHNAIIELTLR